MRSPLSVDLRERVVAAVLNGSSCHQAAARFGVSVSSASRWSARFRREGQVAPKPSGGDHSSHRTLSR
jgi:transposase